MRNLMFIHPNCALLTGSYKLPISYSACSSLEAPPMKLTRFAVAAAITLAAGAASVALAAPASAAPYPPGSTTTTTISNNTIVAGGNVTINVFNLAPGSTLYMYIFSSPVQIGGPVTVGSNGSATITGTVPSNYSGSHTIQVQTTSGEVVASYVVNIVSSGTSGSGSGSGGSLAYTGAAVAGIGGLGVALVAGGIFFVVAGRKRTGKTTV